MKRLLCALLLAACTKKAAEPTPAPPVAVEAVPGETNAENNKSAKIESLRVKEAVAQTASTLKRFTPKARGSAGPILKRNCHVKITLSDE